MLRTLSWMVFFVGLLAVIALSVMPPGAIPNTGLSDKMGHMAAYAALALAGGIAIRGARSLLMLVAGLLLLGLGLELVQALLPSRLASGHDILANVVGITLGSTAAISKNTVMNRRPRTLD